MRRVRMALWVKLNKATQHKQRRACVFHVCALKSKKILCTPRGWLLVSTFHAIHQIIGLKLAKLSAYKHTIRFLLCYVDKFFNLLTLLGYRIAMRSLECSDYFWYFRLSKVTSYIHPASSSQGIHSFLYLDILYTFLQFNIFSFQMRVRTK